MAKKPKQIAKPNRMELSRGPYELTECGLSIVGESTIKDWETCGDALRRVDEARQWAIGDWLCDGKRHYGDGLYKRAAEITGLAEGTLWKFKSLSDLFELFRRRKNLAWAHHAEVASIHTTVENEDGTLEEGNEPDYEAIGRILKDAEKNNWSVVELREAVRKHKEAQRERIRLANEPEKYAVIYADPPWKYNSGDQHSTEEQETVLGTHYPSMDLMELAQLPVPQMAATDSILFLWATSPVLEEAIDLINAWGFKYKTSMVWDKIAHNVGNYVSVRHELLLIATCGTPPKVPRLVDSVYAEERTEHSKKPNYFRDLIDELYPSGKRIEMFCRGPAKDDWDTWGDEAL